MNQAYQVWLSLLRVDHRCFKDALERAISSLNSTVTALFANLAESSGLSDTSSEVGHKHLYSS